MVADAIHISLSAETIFHVGSFAITNSMFTSSLVSLLLIGLALVANRKLTDTDRPTGLQNFMEWVVEALFSLVHSITRDVRKTNRFFPLIATFFLFILLNNWFGLLPGVGTILKTEPTPAPALPLFRAGTADLNTTLALAIISILATQLFGVRAQKLSYFKKFINFSSPIMFFVGILELISEFAKVISFAFRLFGNIFAGEVLLVVIAALLPLGVPLPFYGLEIFVGFIQALVFSMLSLVFFNMATISHEEH